MSSGMTAVVTLERETTDLGIASDEVPAWETVATLRAEVKPLRFSEQEREGAARAVQGYLFRVHTSAVRAHAITASDRFIWDQREFNIREVRQPEARVRFTEIVAETGTTQ